MDNFDLLKEVTLEYSQIRQVVGVRQEGNRFTIVTNEKVYDNALMDELLNHELALIKSHSNDGLSFHYEPEILM